MSAAFRSNETVDFAVVGSGAAGGVVAKELALAGFTVVVLEQGPHMQAKDFKHDEFGVLFQSALTNNPKTQPVTYREKEGDKAEIRDAVNYCRMVGGGSVHFTANYWRFHEVDFEERSRWGAVPGASLADWPIRYRDLEPYYAKAEYDLGVSGLAGANPFDPPRSKPYPMPPLPVKSSGVIFERATRKLGLHPFPAPMAILSQPYKGRLACQHCGFCNSFGCEFGSKSSTLAAAIPAALKSGRCELRAECYVRKVEIDAGGRANGVIYFDKQRREVFQKARAVVLCANGAETPRLLLMSTSNRFPNGLANSSGLVGRNLMFDAGAIACGVFEHPLNEHKSVQVTRLIHDYYDSDPKRGFFGGGGIDARSQAYPVVFALFGLPMDAPRWGVEYKKMLADYFPRTMMLLAHTTCLAQETNSITLDPDVKDAWGLPAMRVTFSWHEDDLKTLRYFEKRMLEIFDAAKPRRAWSYPPGFDLLPSRHLMGTCRMGNDPKTSVVNADNRAHDVANLFIVDGSSLVTSGRQQPTATIQALAYRAADRMAAMARRGGI
ncbi:MAG: GMC family oxidoreductase [Bryobacteraceae bacterium]|nr:GMC family oxidoreductase [Bryobacteraceae bacterium]